MEFEGNSLVSGTDQCFVKGEIIPLLFYLLSFQNIYK